MKFFPSQIDADGQSATVRTEIKRSNGTRIPVNYSLRKTPDGWKAWDVVIEGISYVKSFREDFGTEIDQKGLDAVIQRIEKGGVPTRQARRRKTRFAANASAHHGNCIKPLGLGDRRSRRGPSRPGSDERRAHVP